MMKEKDGKQTAAMVCGIVGMALEFTSIFCFWWLCFVGLTLGIVSVCLGNKVLGWIATGVGAAVSIAEIIFLSLS